MKIHSLKRMACPWKKVIQKGHVIFQPLIFRSYDRFRDGKRLKLDFCFLLNLRHPRKVPLGQFAWLRKWAMTFDRFAPHQHFNLSHTSSWWLFPKPFEKICSNWIISPGFGVKIKKYLEPPPIDIQISIQKKNYSENHFAATFFATQQNHPGSHVSFLPATVDSHLFLPSVSLDAATSEKKSIPSRELTYPTWGKGKASSKVPFWGVIC